MYSEAEAARLLQLAQNTLHYWLEGGSQRGKTYQPIVRLAPSGGRPPVTWAEFIEAGLLRRYRREHGLPMAELRAFVDRLREHSGVPYPLAHCRPFVAGRELVREAQDDARSRSGVLPGRRGPRPVDPHAGIAGVFRSGHVDRRRRGLAPAWGGARIDPEIRFGRPAVKGISTEVLWEHVESGEDPEGTAEAFGLSCSTSAGHSLMRRRCGRREPSDEAGDRPLLFRR